MWLTGKALWYRWGVRVDWSCRTVVINNNHQPHSFTIIGQLPQHSRARSGAVRACWGAGWVAPVVSRVRIAVPVARSHALVYTIWCISLVVTYELPGKVPLVTNMDNTATTSSLQLCLLVTFSKICETCLLCCVWSWHEILSWNPIHRSNPLYEGLFLKLEY